MKKYLSKSDMIGAIDRVFEDVEIPEWGGTVCVQSLTAAEKDRFEAGLTRFENVRGRAVTMPNLVNMRARMVALCVVDGETHQRLFTDSDALELGNKSASALDRIVEVCKRLSRWSDADLDQMTGDLKNDPPVASAIA